MDEFEGAFVREARSGIRALNDGLLAIEAGDDASVDELFRVAHSLKGTCRTQGVADAGELAHALEDVLDALRGGEVTPATAPIDEALAVVDCLEAVVRAYANDDELERDVDAALESLRSALDERRGQSPPSEETGGAGSRGPADSPGDEWDPAGSELSDDVIAALEDTTEFDDLDALLDDGDGASDENLDGWGLLDEDETGDPEEAEPNAVGAEPPEESESGDEAEPREGTEHRDGTGSRDGAETPDDPSAFFEETKSDIDEAGAIDSLQADIDAVEFGEFDDDDNYTIDELMALDPEESSPVDGGAPPEEADDATGIEDGSDPAAGENVGETGETTDPSPAVDPDEAIDPGQVVEPDETIETEGPAAPDEATASPSAETSADEGEAAGDAADGFVFGDPEEDTASQEPELDDRTAASDGQTVGPEVPASEAADSVSEADEPASEAGESGVEATADSVPGPDSLSDSVPDPDSLPDSVPETDLDVELSGDLDADSDDWADDSEMDVSVDEGMAEFESRFGDLLGGGPGGEAQREGPTFRAAVSTIEESRLDGDEFPTAAAAREPDGPGEFDRLQELTVDVDTADRLLNVAEELSLTHLRLDEAVGPDTSEAIAEEVETLQRVVTEYRRTVMDVRLVPLGTAIEPIPRTVRDVARSQDKEVDLAVEDADVELDRGIVDELRDPLVHVARNAVDHGIEPPDERTAAGKPPEGTVEIRAERVGDRVVIEVSDDGRGIDPEAVRQRAVDTGVLTPKEARRLDDDAVYDLVFEPGFTTREEVTDVSGRGVGMDVVSRTVADLDGSVTVESTPGEGTTVRLTVPVSIVFTEVLFVEANRETFGIPMSVVEQITATPPIRTDDGREVVRRSDLDVIGGFGDGGAADDGSAARAQADGGEVEDAEGEASDDAEAEDSYPLIRLESALDLQEDAGPDEGSELHEGNEADEEDRRRSDEEGQVVWVREEDESLAIRCDRVVTSREVVVRPYGDLLREVPGVGGATTLGDGEAVNVLDVGSI